MAGFQSVLKAIGYTTGVVTGGPSQVKAVAGAVAAHGKIASYLEQFGQKIGGIVGPDLFNNIAKGATVTGNKETAAFVNTTVLTGTTKSAVTIAFVGVFLVAGYFFYRNKK